MCSARRVVEEYYVRRVRDGQRDADELQQRLPEAHRSSAAARLSRGSLSAAQTLQQGDQTPSRGVAGSRASFARTWFIVRNRDRRPLLLP